MHEPTPSPPDSDLETPGLDPDDWDAFAASAHRALDAALAHMRSSGERSWRPLPTAARADIEGPLPRRPGDLDEVLGRVERSILPYPTGNAHRRFWGWVIGTGTADGMLADMLAAAMNPHVAGYDQSATVVEAQVVRWLAEVMGYPDDASGLLVSGGTMANLVGVAVARHHGAGFDVRSRGLAGGPPLRVYGSVETHSWVEKCCDVLGLGRDAVRRIAADADGRIDLAALRAAILSDRRAGHRPLCVVGNAGTVDTGSIDDLEALADLCREEDLWLHVDGAFGALAVLVPSLRPGLRGLERSDSVAFDLHKWGYLPYEIGCVLVRERGEQRATFATEAAYLESPGRGVQPEPLYLAELGIQLSRGFRALKAWMALEVHGVERIGRVIENNVMQAQHLVARIEADPCLELLAPAPLNVVCFRHRGGDPATPPDEASLEALNREILLQLQERGIAVGSSTRRAGRFALRVAITNHRSRRADIDLFVDAILALGEELTSGGR
ncbi:MAG: pyridoxal-dependent decarboxylase [Acidobacteriota bacterium]